MEQQPYNPWRTRGSRVVYRNSWMTVREDAVIRPDGSGVTRTIGCAWRSRLVVASQARRRFGRRSGNWPKRQASRLGLLTPAGFFDREPALDAPAADVLPPQTRHNARGGG